MSDQTATMPLTEAVEINPKIKLERGKEYLFVEMADLDENVTRVRSKGEKAFSGSGAKFAHGDTLFARITPCLENGKIAKFVSDNPSSNGFGSTEFIVFRGREGITTTEYAHYVATDPNFRAFAISKMTGSSGRQRVPVDALDHFRLVVPPIPQQNAITKILGDLDEKIDLLSDINATLEEIARAVFRAWFVDFEPVHAKAAGATSFRGMPQDLFDLLPAEFEPSEIGNIPKGWSLAQISEFLELAYGKSLPSKTRKAGSVRVYGSGGVTGYHNEKLIDGPSVIVGRKGTVGSVFWEDGAAFPIDTVFYVVPKNAELMFCYQLLKALPLRSMNMDAAVPGLNRKSVLRLKFPMPTPELLEAYDLLVSPLWKKRELNIRALETNNELRDTLLPKLISGEICFNLHILGLSILKQGKWFLNITSTKYGIILKRLPALKQKQAPFKCFHQLGNVLLIQVHCC